MQCRYLNNVLPPQALYQNSPNHSTAAKAAEKVREWVSALDTYLHTKRMHIVNLKRQEGESDAEKQESNQPSINRTNIKSLRKAILEYYRSLQLLKNYQTLNRVALEKALKKYSRHFEDW